MILWGCGAALFITSILWAGGPKNSFLYIWGSIILHGFASQNLSLLLLRSNNMAPKEWAQPILYLVLQGLTALQNRFLLGFYIQL